MSIVYVFVRRTTTVVDEIFFFFLPKPHLLDGDPNPQSEAVLKVGVVHVPAQVERWLLHPFRSPCLNPSTTCKRYTTRIPSNLSPKNVVAKLNLSLPFLVLSV